jgi:diguanylate cyclase (GGDEF)-like protein
MIEILCTATGIVAGVAIVASLLQGRGSRNQFERNRLPDVAAQSEQIQGIADQLKLLSFRVAEDVTAHSERVEAINERLTGGEPVEQPEQILSAINDLIAANQTMQGQLADARRRIAHQSEMIEAAAYQARTDALTGLANRRALNEFMENSLGAIAQGELPALLLLDIDHFKSFNDTYGHTTGDAVLSAFARNIKKWCDQQCFPARYGGEEFAVILTGRDPLVIAQRAAELRTFVSDQLICCEDLELRITASAGLCLLEQGDTLESAYSRADEGLYRSKKAGRNCGFWLNGEQWENLNDRLAAASLFAPGEPGGRNRSAFSGSTHLPGRKSTHHSMLPEWQAHNATADSVVSLSGHTHSIALPGCLEPWRSDLASGDVLDLPTFTPRIGLYIEQLQKAHLPAAAMLVKAVWGTPPKDPAQAKASWSAVQSLIQSQLRGIDVMCAYSEATVCAFLPGCSHDIALERGARMQALLEDIRSTWESDSVAPDRLTIAAATAVTGEVPSALYIRLESALSAGAHCGRFELMLHDGQRVVCENGVHV